MTSSWEELRYTGSVETSLGKTESCSETRSTSTNDNGIVFVILDLINLCIQVELSNVHTTTGYLLLTKGDASFARRGACVIIRAGKSVREPADT
jgi:hypothetical protein